MLKIIPIKEEPVISPQKVVKQLKANQVTLDNFKGEFSSITGIQSKGMYITKLNGLSSEPETPITTIISDKYIHTDPSKVRVAIGTYGKSWSKIKSFIPIEVGKEDDLAYCKIDN